MSDLKTTRQMPGGVPTGRTPPGEEGEENSGADFGTRRPGTAGTNRDADPSGESKNQKHGHPREERSR